MDSSDSLRVAYYPSRIGLQYLYYMVRLVPLLLLLGFGISAGAHCSHADATKRKQRARTGAKTTVASPLLNDYDLKHVHIDLEMDNRSTTISGNTISTIGVLKPGGMSQYAFELNRNLTIDSMKVNGVAVTPLLSPGADLYTVSFGTPQAQGSTFLAQVWYHGTGSTGTGFFTHGLNHYSLPSGTNITYTLSDQYLSKDWWPCKQTLVDKIDSAELWITVADSLKAGSNGTLQRITPLSGNRSRYEWKTRYPVAYYLLSVAVAPYGSYQQTVRFSGSTDTMPVLHYIYDTAAYNRTYKPALDSTPLIVDHFSTLFGRYPFWKEKYGHCVAPLGGGMEHQTMTTMSSITTTTLVAHELGHQWWGNHVTYRSWRDIWLSEGFASYCEDLFLEQFRGAAAMRTHRTGKYNSAMAQTGGSVYVDDTDDVYRVFDSRLTYDKGSAVTHVLRYFAPNDAAFFTGLQMFQQRYAFGHATTDSLKSIMETAYGYRLDSFFRQWIYGEGYPTYTASWNRGQGRVFVRLKQTTSKPASVPLFNVKVPLRLIGNNRDTIVYAQLNSGDSVYRFDWNEAVTGLQIDPDNQIINRNGQVTEEPGLSVGAARMPNAAYVFPNPAEDAWMVHGLQASQSLELRDASGKRILSTKADGQGHARIDSSRLAAGIYTLHSPDEPRFAMKLQRR